MNSFQSIIASIDGNIQSLEWTTDTGHKLHGVLFMKDCKLILNLNTANLSKAVKFEYIYHEDQSGSKRILYPFGDRSSKYIPVGPISKNWPIQVYMIFDEGVAKIPEFEKRISFLFDSFLWTSVPNSKEEKGKYETAHTKMTNVETAIGKVSVDLNIGESYSAFPAESKKYMNQIAITVMCDEEMSNREIALWEARFAQYLTFIHKERVVPRSIEKSMGSILIPSLVKDHERQSYAWREPISLQDFSEYISSTLKIFVDKYSELVDLLEDLTRYYLDYPLHPPDGIQLLRLFTSVEQAANLAQKNEKILKTSLSKEENERKQEFDIFLRLIKPNKDISDEVKQYLNQETKKFYVSSGSKSALKHKIRAFAGIIQDEYEAHSPFTNMQNIELMLGMRNLLAHGRGKRNIRDEFYKHRNDFGQGAEELVRAYVLRLLGADNEVVIRHKNPLKAIQFNIE